YRKEQGNNVDRVLDAESRSKNEERSQTQKINTIGAPAAPATPCPQHCAGKQNQVPRRCAVDRREAGSCGSKASVLLAGVQEEANSPIVRKGVVDNRMPVETFSRRYKEWQKRDEPQRKSSRRARACLRVRICNNSEGTSTIGISLTLRAAAKP